MAVSRRRGWPEASEVYKRKVEERALVDLPAGETLPAILGGDVTDERAAGQGVHEAHRVLQLLETKAAQ